MIAVRLIPQAEFEKKLSPYGCKKLADLEPGFELWETGWGEPFTVFSEDGGVYDEWQLRAIIAGVIATTMPADWNS